MGALTCQETRSADYDAVAAYELHLAVVGIEEAEREPRCSLPSDCELERLTSFHRLEKAISWVGGLRFDRHDPRASLPGEVGSTDLDPAPGVRKAVVSHA